MSHAIRMVLGCVLPLLLIFSLPLLGVDGGPLLLVAVVVMFGCHLMMLRGDRPVGGHAKRDLGKDS